MNREQFTEILTCEGFQEVLTLTQKPDGFVDTHTHAWEVKALVLRGELTLTFGGAQHHYKTGDIFSLPLAEPHAERYGPEGVEFLTGRKYPAATVPR